MKKKLMLIIIPLAATVLLGILSVLAFYSIPLVKTNSLLISANKSNAANEFDGNHLISQENYEKLRIINKVISEDEYVQIKTDKKYKFVDFKNVDLICSVTATIDSFEENITSEKISGNIKISFSFTDFRWIVSDVESF